MRGCYSIPKDKKDKKVENKVPGPGSYNPNTKQSTWQAPSTKIGIESRNKIQQNNTPGPGNYSPSLLHSQHFHYSFNKQKQRPSVSKQEGPGPASYHVQLDKAVSYTIAPKYKPVSTFQTPGVGCYDIALPITNTQQNNKTHKTNNNNNNNNNKLKVDQGLGPGYYFQTGHQGMGPFFTISKEGMKQKKQQKQQQQTPGPGAYNTPEYLQQKFKSKLIKQQSKKREKREWNKIDQLHDNLVSQKTKDKRSQTQNYLKCQIEPQQQQVQVGPITFLLNTDKQQVVEQKQSIQQLYTNNQQYMQLHTGHWNDLDQMHFKHFVSKQKQAENNQNTKRNNYFQVSDNPNEFVEQNLQYYL